MPDWSNWPVYAALVWAALAGAFTLGWAMGAERARRKAFRELFGAIYPGERGRK